MEGRKLRKPIDVRSTPFALVALVAIAGCGHKKVQRSQTPVTVPGPAATTAATEPTATAAKPATGTKARTVLGQDIPTRFGDVQVAVTFRGNRITDVQGRRLPFDRPRSQSISDQAAPILRSEVLSAQSARIYLVSGASFTSDAWAQSVQSAIDAPH